MKKISNLIVLILSVAVMASCEKVLDKEPLTDFTNSNFWTSEKNVEMFANYFYNEWVGYGNGTSTNGVFYWQTLNDNQISSGFQDWYSRTVDASNGTWNGSYTEIRRANTLIEKVPGIEGMSDAAKNHWVGVGRLYRALYHYYLVRSFGDCVWVDHVLDVTEEDRDGFIFSARTDRDIVMDKVLEDLNFAVSNIRESSSRVEMNRAVAQAIKSEICLYEGTFCKYRSSADGQKAADSGRAQKFLTECKTASEAIINNGNYALGASYRAVYNSIDLNGNKEMIMYKKYALENSFCHSLIDYTCSSTMQSGMSKAAFDSYLFRDGNCLANTTLDKNDHAVFTESGSTWVADISEVLANRDPRLSESIDANLMYNGTPYQRYGVGHLTTSSSGYGVLKFDTNEIPVAYRPEGGKNYTDAPIFWLAEILLNHAEACVELGDNAAAVNSINKLRARAGMPNLTTSPAADPANNMGVSDLIWEVRRERRVEMMYDKNDRYWSLIRWHQLDKLDTSKYPDIAKGAWVGNHLTESSTAKADANGYIDMTGKGTRTYDKKHYLRPIPSGQLDLNPNLGQNPGW
jgi:SusD family.